MFSEVRKRAKKSGQPPGTPIYTGSKTDTPPEITVITYDGTNCIEKTGQRLEDCMPKQKVAGMTWINVEGLSDVDGINQLAKQFHLHPLTVEDILNVEQRPKVEEFDGYLFITLKALNWQTKSALFSVKQVSIILGKNFVLSFQELDTTLFDPIRHRLKSTANQRLRQQGGDYLVYRLIDAVVDDYFVVLEALGEEVEKTEERIIAAPNPQNARTIYRLKRQMLWLRKAIWPMREALSHLMHVEENLVTKFTRVYLRDVYDHCVQAIDTLETFRDMLSSMLDMYLSSLTNRMNEVMKTLTIIATIFIPITAIASIYGMNFSYLPGQTLRWGFFAIVGLMIVAAIVMLFFFRKKRWL